MDNAFFTAKFATNLMVKQQKNKQYMEKIKTVTPSDFYKKLTKKDKSKFLTYMHIKYALKPATLVRKLSDKSNDTLTVLEESVINDEIKKGLWRK